MGRPKALVDDWLVRSVHVLADGGCGSVTVVLGASAHAARALLDGVRVDVPVRAVVADDWADGMAASLRAGLHALGAAASPDRTAPVAALVHLVDLPDVDAEVVRRVVAVAGTGSLARAVYAGRPGHPVLLGRDYWATLVAEARGDRGARDLLAARPHLEVECGDLAAGHDVDS